MIQSDHLSNSSNISMESIMEQPLPFTSNENRHHFNEGDDIPYPPIGSDIKIEELPIDFHWRDANNLNMFFANNLNMDPNDIEIPITQMDDRETKKCQQCGFTPSNHKMITRSQKNHKQCIKFGVICKNCGLRETYMLTRHQEMKIKKHTKCP